MGGWVLVPKIIMHSLVALSVHSTFHWWSGQCTTHVVVVRLTDEMLCGVYKWVFRFETLYVCTQWMGECEWSRIPDSMAQRARDWVAPLRQSSAGWMPARIGRLSAGVGCRHPVTIRKALLMAGWWGGYEHCGTRQVHITPWLKVPGLGWLFAELLLQHPNQSEQAASGVWRMILTSCKVTLCERPVQRYSEVFGLGAEGQVFLLYLTLS